jgi:alkylation response protein AidB-like acyl-CoA dehydrogenase
MTQGQTLLQAAIGLEPYILAVRDAIDRDRALPPELVEKLRTAGLLHLWLPKAIGGPELHPAELLPVIEALARADGSVGWCATTAAVLSLVSGSLPAPTAQAIFGHRAVAAGAAQPTGKAVVVEGGYRVTGRWGYGSGIGHSDWIGAGTIVHDGDDPRLTPSGASEMRFMFIPKSSAEVFDTWNVSGMRGTGSHDYAVADIFVPADHTAPAMVVAPVQPGMLYRVPPMSLFALALTCVTLGIARAAVDALVELAVVKTPAGSRSLLRDLASVQSTVARAEALVRAGRAVVLEAVGSLWAATEDGADSGTPVSLRKRAGIRLACTYCAEACAQAVDLVHAASGGSAIQESGRIARCFRDIHAATQHIGLNLANYEPTGRVLLGLELGTPRF